MQEFQVRLQSVLDVQEFVSLATARPFSVTIQDENNKVNGKSFMEMFCLDFSVPITARMDCSQEEFQRFRADAARFETKGR